MVNASAEGVEFTLPPPPAGTPWCLVLNTEDLEDPFPKIEVGDKIIVGGRSLRLFSDGLT
jgi:glycogen operon protein